MMGVRLELIDFFDPTGRSVIRRVPAEGSVEIRPGVRLVVQPGQRALLVREGQVYDEFSPGQHTLTRANLPLVTRALAVPWERSPFEASVFFVGLQPVVDLKWGTKQPIPYRDSEFALVRLRSFGKFSFRVLEPRLLLEALVRTQGSAAADHLEDFLRDQIVSRLTEVLGTLLHSILDLPARYDDVAAAARASTAEDFRGLGLELLDLLVSTISPPNDIQIKIDTRSGMAAANDPGRSPVTSGVSDATRDVPAASAPASLASVPAPTTNAPRFCEECGQPVSATAKFCSNCGFKLPS